MYIQLTVHVYKAIQTELHVIYTYIVTMGLSRNCFEAIAIVWPIVIGKERERKLISHGR